MAGLIRTTAELQAAADEIRTDGLLSLDTEFVWKSTYRPRLGIVQLGSRTNAWAVDCLTALDTAALKSLIEDESVVKILHDARQDLTHIHHWTGALPVNVFDTQLAAAFAGFPAGIGLQKLLFEAIDIGLAKTETLTDWLQRPLTDAQVAYALDDVKYLPALKDELVRRAAAFGNLDYLFAEELKYDDPALYADGAAQDLWKKIRLNRTRLDGKGRAILMAVASLREELARKWNLPRNWLGDDASLVQMAVSRRVAHLAHRLRGGQGDTLRALYDEAIGKALKTPDESCPADPKRHFISEVLDATKMALAYLDERAHALHIDPTVIANRATMTAYIDDVSDDTNPLATGWRYEVVGADIAERFGVD